MMDWRDAWTWVALHAKWFIKGSLGFCDHCGSLTECYLYGDSVLSHRAVRGMHRSLPPVPLYAATLVVCMKCSMRLDDKHNVHEGCWCRKKVIP